MAAFTTQVATSPIYHQSPEINRLSISVSRSAETIQDEWIELQETGLATPCQSFASVMNWQKADAEPAGEDVRIVTIRDESGALVAILPLTICRSRGMSVARWANHGSINYGMPVMSVWFARTVAHNPFQFLRLVGEAITDVDVLHIGQQPASWHGVDNPFADTFNDVSTHQTSRTGQTDGIGPENLNDWQAAGTAPLAETVFPVTGRGYGYTALILSRIKLQQTIENSVSLWKLATGSQTAANPAHSRI